jgi:hypothetical protein
MAMKYGWYSPAAFKKFSSKRQHDLDKVLYDLMVTLTSDMSEVEHSIIGHGHYIQIGPNNERVTCWTDDEEGADYKWEDKILVGYFDPNSFKSVKIPIDKRS